MILIVADERDPHARHVQAIARQAGTRAAILDFSGLARGTRYVHEVGGESSAAWLRMSEDIDFSEVSTIWLRRPAAVDAPGAVLDGAARQFIRHEWSESVNGMSLSLPDVRWVNHPFAQATASKALQLEVARRVGLTVPDTVITNDPARARAFVATHRGKVVHKAFTAPATRPIDTRRWSNAEDARHLDCSLPLAPVIFQEYIRGPADIRTVLVGGRFFTVLFHSSTSRAPVDSRLDLDVRCVPHNLPALVEDALARLMARLGLVFGVIDLKLDDRGQHFFLEVNPQGQFLFMEILTQLPISAGVAAFLGAGEAGRVPPTG